MAADDRFSVYLDQNLLGHLIHGAAARQELLAYLNKLKDRGAVFVYSNVHVEECRAYAKPEEYADVLDEIQGHHILPNNHLPQGLQTELGSAHDLILKEENFAEKSTALLDEINLISQFCLGWLGEADAADLKDELALKIEYWAQEVERETLGLVQSSRVSEEMLTSLNSLDIAKIKQDGQIQYALTNREWTAIRGQLDVLVPEQVADFVFSKLDEKTQTYLLDMFPKVSGRNGEYLQSGTLTGLAFLLFIRGVGWDGRVRRNTQMKRRKRFQAQLRDCRHIEEAAFCHCFLSDDEGAVKLAKATYAHAGISTLVKRVIVQNTYE